MAQIRYLFADCEEALQRGGCCPVGRVSPDFISLQNELFVEPGPLFWLLFQSKNAYLQAEFPTIKQEQLAVYL